MVEPIKKAKCDASCNTSPEKPAVLKCHDYMETTCDWTSYEVMVENPELADMCHRFEEYKSKADKLDKMNDSAQILSLDNVKDNPKLMKYYTGLPDYIVFLALFNYLKPKAECMKYPYGERTMQHSHFEDKGMSRRPGRQRGTTLDQELFMVLVRLKLGLPSTDTAIRFGISDATFSSIFTAWVTLLSIELEKINKLPPTDCLDENLAADCFNDFSNVKIVIDCTELFSETPSSLNAHKQFHSNYKHHSTVKFLVGMNCGGAITYISSMFGGRSSDKYITSCSSDLINELLPGEKVMADRGFTIEENLPSGVKLIIPGFKHKDKTQFTKTEIQQNKKISEARVHIERAIRRIKQFLVLKHEVKLSQINVYENMFKACGYLVNFQDPFLKCAS